MSNKEEVRGTVKEVRSGYYIIKGDDGKDYFAHIGDIKENEKLIESNTIRLNQNDVIEFTAINQSKLPLNRRAIHIKKIK